MLGRGVIGRNDLCKTRRGGHIGIIGVYARSGAVLETIGVLETDLDGGLERHLSALRPEHGLGRGGHYESGHRRIQGPPLVL